MKLTSFDAARMGEAERGIRVCRLCFKCKGYAYLASLPLLIKRNLASAYIVHSAHQPNLSFFDNFAQYDAPIAKLLHGEFDIHFRDRLNEICVS